jgi:hypothetical protein
MAAGSVHYENDDRDLVGRKAPGAKRTVEPPHWMLMWPMMPSLSGLPIRNNEAGSYIMDEGTPWAHLMVYQNPMTLSRPPR